MTEPIWVSIAAAVASKAVESIYDLVKKRFAGRRAATEVLEAAHGAAPDSPEVRALSEELAQTENEDPEFAARLRLLWHDESVEQRADRGGVANQVSGGIGGKAVQARDIEGGVSL